MVKEHKSLTGNTYEAFKISKLIILTLQLHL